MSRGSKFSLRVVKFGSKKFLYFFSLKFVHVTDPQKFHVNSSLKTNESFLQRAFENVRIKKIK